MKLIVVIGLILLSQVLASDITVGYYTDEDCSKLAFPIQTFKTSKQCVLINSTLSASDLQCYKGQICYVQYLNEKDCTGDSIPGFATESCTPPVDDSFPFFAKIISGTDDCEEVEEDFTCYKVEDNDDEEESSEDDPKLIAPRDYTIIIFVTLVVICESIAVVRAILLYKQGPPTHATTELGELDDITMTDLSVVDLEDDDLILGDDLILDDTPTIEEL